MAQIIDGKKLAIAARHQTKLRAARVSPLLDRAPGLGVVLVGDDPASHVYVASKEKAARECGIEPLDRKLPSTVSQSDLHAVLDDLNGDPRIDGILLQLPLPKHLNELDALQRISVKKDVDGLTPLNQGLLYRGAECFEPCTPRGCLKLIETALNGESLTGKRAVVCGRSVLVGKPVAAMLLNRDCTVFSCHSKTRNLNEICKGAEIAILAVGRPNMFTAEFFSPNAIVIDVGMNRMEDGKLLGDVDFESVSRVVRAITPVPGGVGPMTIAMLLENTVLSAERTAQTIENSR